MTKEQEAQQAQTLAEIRAIRNGGEYPREYYREAIDKALVLIHSQAQKISEQANELIEAKGANILLNEQNENLRNRVAEQAKEIEQAKSLAGIATKRFFEAKQSAEKYRNAYVYANARRDGHHPQSMLHAEVLPWERWDAEKKRPLDLTDLGHKP
jgi:regulator of replication initiation timing